MSDFPFPGLNLALATPFDTDGKIDYGQLEANIERYIDAGVPSFLVSSGTGLHLYVSREETDELVARASKIINGRAKIIVQTSALLVEDIVDRTRYAADCGADGVMILPPFYEGPGNDDDLFAFYEAACAGGLPVVGYNTPGAAPAILPDLYRRLMEIPNFVSVKDSRGDMLAETDLIRTGLPVLNGADPLAAYALYAGAAGVIWGGANFAPRACVAFVNAAMRGDWDQARELWRPLEPPMSFLWQGGDYIEMVYAAAELAGYPAGAPRRPFSAVSPERVATIKSAFGDLLAAER